MDIGKVRASSYSVWNTRRGTITLERLPLSSTDDPWLYSWGRATALVGLWTHWEHIELFAGALNNRVALLGSIKNNAGVIMQCSDRTEL